MGKLKIKSLPSSSKNNTQKEGDESHYQHIQRNISQAAGDLYAFGRSGLGAGDIAQAAAQESNAPSWLKTGLRYVLPSRQQAKEQYGYGQNLISQASQAISPGSILQKIMNRSGVPEDAPAQDFARSITPEVKPASYYSESRPEDYWTQHGIQAGISLGTGGLLGGVPGLVRAGLGHAGALAGSSIGSEVGREIGSEFGYPETGSRIGNVSGGLAGAHYAPKAVDKFRNRPSKMLPDLEEAEKSKLTNVEKHYDGEITNIDDYYTGKINETENVQGQQFSTFLKENENALRAIEDAYEGKLASNKNMLDNVHNSVIKYDENIAKTEAAQAPLYTLARELEGGAAGTPAIIQEAITEANLSLSQAVTQGDVSLVNQLFKGLEADVNSGNLSINGSKRYAKRLNDQIYNHNNSNTVKEILRPVRDALNEYTAEVGSQEHADVYGPAREATVTYKDLKKKRKDFRTVQQKEFMKLKAERAELKRQKSLEINRKKRDQKIELDKLKKNQTQEIETLKYERSKELERLKEQRAQSVFDQKQHIENVNKLSKKAEPLAAAGFGAVLGKMFGWTKLGSVLGLGSKAFESLQNNAAIIKLALERHPEIVAKYEQLNKNFNYLSEARALTTLNAIGYQLEDAIEEVKNEPPTRRGKLKLKG